MPRPPKKPHWSSKFKNPDPNSDLLFAPPKGPERAAPSVPLGHSTSDFDAKLVRVESAETEKPATRK